MICPDCGQDMKKEVVREPWGFVDTEDYYHEITTYKCKKCKIQFIKNDVKTPDEWIVPFYLQPSDKQIKACEFTSQRLGLEMPAPTKKAMWKFLKENLNKAKQLYEYDTLINNQ